jgi:HK97 family phage prohead protease
VERKALKFEIKKDDIAGRVFSGYASTFDVDLGGDIITQGAFKKTIEGRQQAVKILWQHNEPIGKSMRLYEDSIGLFVEGKVSKTRLGDEALELMRDRVVDQMSIGFSIPAGKSEMSEEGLRIIREVKLYEFSPVTFPMNENAIITSVKNMKDALALGKVEQKDLKELSELLTDIKTLLSTEPPKNTQPLDQPSELDVLMKALDNFGATANNKS